MRFLTTLTLAALWFAQTQPARADVLRCGSVLIEPGATAGYVLEKCGPPTLRTKLSEPVWARSVNGTMYETGETVVSAIWRYDRGPGRFPAVVKVADGVVQDIQFEKTRE